MREGRRVCSKCNKPKLLSAFYQRSDGQPYRHCKSCHRKLLDASRRKREEKGERKCNKCRNWKPLDDFIFNGENIGRCSACRAEHGYRPGGSRKKKIEVRDGQQQCIKCKEWKDLETGFHKNKSNSTGRQTHCKTCQGAMTRAYQAEQRKKDPEGWKKKQAENCRRWRKKNGKKSRHSPKAYRYGITLDEYRELELEAGGCCMICNKETEELHIDHDHSTEGVRGLLCPQCNKGIGFFEDNPEMLLKAIEYLQRQQIMPTREKRGETGRMFSKISA